jgi:hypothetical protein
MVMRLSRLARGCRNSEKAQVADLAFGSVDLVSAYSKRSDLLVDLDRIVQQLGQADGGTNSQSVLSTGRIGGAHSLQDRLTDADVRQIVLSFQGGTPCYKIAAKYSISVRSVGRLLRKWRDGLT